MVNTAFECAAAIETAEKPESNTVEPENLSKEWDTVETPEKARNRRRRPENLSAW